jgi:hypothetical protein
VAMSDEERPPKADNILQFRQKATEVEAYFGIRYWIHKIALILARPRSCALRSSACGGHLLRFYRCISDRLFALEGLGPMIAKTTTRLLRFCVFQAQAQQHRNPNGYWGKSGHPNRPHRIVSVENYQTIELRAEDHR